jgi:ATP-dependent Clp protease adaptor protein ClpS
MFDRPLSPRFDDEPATAGPLLRRYNVVLHRAADKALLAVVRAVRELTRFAEAEAMARMWEAHHDGRAVVLATHLERAELYVEQFADKGLRATLEPAG